jgi:uncharacterized surface protein with fasciclin (FAS1) repeats
MKFAIALPFAALAGAFVLPAVQRFKNFVNNHHDGHASWLNSLPSKDSIVSSFGDIFDSVSTGIDQAAHSVDQFLNDEIADQPHGHGSANLTIYQLISLSNHTTKFAKLVNKHDSIVKLLNSTDANYTLFVPTDKAFERIPEHHKNKPSKEFLEALLKYHVGAGFYPAGRILATPTLPTLLEEKLLGDQPQRLRTSVGLSGLTVNFYSKVVAANFVRTPICSSNHGDCAVCADQ